MSQDIIHHEEKSFFENTIDNVKSKAYYLSLEIEKDQLIRVFDYIEYILCDLDTNDLSIEEYNEVFSIILDELIISIGYLKSKLLEELIELYKKSQNNKSLLVRNYLICFFGKVICEKINENLEDNSENSQSNLIYMLISDVLKFIKSQKSPLKGLYLRFFYIKIYKNILNNTNESQIQFFIDSLLFNFEQVCLLWNKLGSLQEKEVCKTLVGESISRLANIEGLSREIYISFILTKLLDIILNLSSTKNDSYVQSYLLECIIMAFPIELNLYAIKSIFSAVGTIKNLSIGGLFIINFLKKSNSISQIDNEQENELLFAVKSFLNGVGFKNDSVPKLSFKESYIMIDVIYHIVKFLLKIENDKDDYQERLDFILKNISYFNSVLCIYFGLSVETGYEKAASQLGNVYNKIYQIIFDVINIGRIDITDYSLFDQLYNKLPDQSKVDICVLYIEHIMKINKKINSKVEIDKIFDLLSPILIKLDKYDTNKLNNKRTETNNNLDDDNTDNKKSMLNTKSKQKQLNTHQEEGLISKIINQITEISNVVYIYEILDNLKIKSIFIFNTIINKMIVILNHNQIHSSLSLIDFIKKSKEIILNKLYANKDFSKVNNYTQYDEIRAYKYLILYLMNINNLVNKEKVDNQILNIEIVNTIQSIYDYIISNEIDSSLIIFSIDSYIEDLIYPFLNMIILYKNLLLSSSSLKLESIINGIYQKSSTFQKRSDQLKLILILIKAYVSITNIMDVEFYNDLIESAIEYSDYAYIVNKFNMIFFVDILNLIVFLINKGLMINKKLIEKLNMKIKNIIKTIKEEKDISQKKTIETSNIHVFDMIDRSSKESSDESIRLFNIEKYYLNIKEIFKNDCFINNSKCDMTEYIMKINLD